jgi:alkylation response protein AidB-like acyl-CoA dehydrogenase
MLAWQRWWLSELDSAGYAVPHWTTQHGGGAILAQQVVLHEELVRADAPELSMFVVSLNHAAATLETCGSPSQQALLAGIRQGAVWCQGFSEPEAGSDLAALRTRAVRHGDRYLVNGQKVWSSYAHIAKWCLLLARTDPSAPKRKGISFLLLDMESPGIEVRPIRQMNGGAEFNEIFLHDVEIPVANLVGAENDGWRVAQTTLSSERGPAVLGLAERLRQLGQRLTELAVRTGAIEDGGVRQLLGRDIADVEILRLLSARLVQNLISSGRPGPEASVLKLYFSELLQRLTDHGIELEGLEAHTYDTPVPVDSFTSGVWFVDHLSSWTWTIAAGTNEIQRNLIGERALGLPREEWAR